MLDIFLTLNEIVLMTTHSYVLAGYGAQYKFDLLYQRIWYFMWDFMNPNLSYFLVLRESNKKLLLFIWSHTLIHIHLILTWSTQYTINIILLSTDDVETREKYPFWERYWYYIGTSHDVITHSIMAYLLISKIFKTNTSIWAYRKMALIFLLYSMFLAYFSNMINF